MHLSKEKKKLEETAKEMHNLVRARNNGVETLSNEILHYKYEY